MKTCFAKGSLALVALGVLWVTSSGFGPMEHEAAPAVHGDEDMDAARQAMVTFAYAMLTADEAAAATVLHDDLTTSWGATKKGVLAAVAGSPHWERRFELRHAFFKKVGKRIRVSPVIQYFFQGRYVVMFELIKNEKKWQIVSITNAEPPIEIQEADDRLPEHHLLFPVDVHLRDADTGEPVFARVSVTDSDGDYWPPEGHLKNVHTGWNPDVGGDAKVGGKSFAYVRSDFTLPLPVGSYDLEVVRGMEYEPFTAHFEVTDSKPVTLDVELERWSDVAQDGWYSGDTHVHFIDPTNGMLEMKGEDLNVLNILVTKWAELITNAEHFTGAPSLLSEPEHIVYVNEESRHNFYGHTNLLNLKKLVYPLAWGPGGAGVVSGHDGPTMADVLDRTHEQGGFVAWAHFPYPSGELAVDMALGKVDSIDLMTMGDAFNDVFGLLGPADTWYRFLSLGFRVPATAGTDKMTNQVVLGAVRTYVKVDGPLSYQGWIDGIRAGRTFTTTGPMMKFSVDGAEIGDTITTSSGKTVTVNVEVSSRIPMERIEIIVGGEIVATKENPTGARKVSFTVDVPIDGSTWIAARTSSSEHLPFNVDIPIFAHTSPIYVEVPGRPIGSAEDAAYFAKQCEDAIVWAKTKAKLLDESQRAEMVALYEKALQVYLDMAAASLSRGDGKEWNPPDYESGGMGRASLGHCLVRLRTAASNGQGLGQDAQGTHGLEAQAT